MGSIQKSYYYSQENGLPSRLVFATSYLRYFTNSITLDGLALFELRIGLEDCLLYYYFQFTLVELSCSSVIYQICLFHFY